MAPGNLANQATDTTLNKWYQTLLSQDRLNVIREFRASSDQEKQALIRDADTLSYMVNAETRKLVAELNIPPSAARALPQAIEQIARFNPSDGPERLKQTLAVIHPALVGINLPSQMNLGDLVVRAQRIYKIHRNLDVIAKRYELDEHMLLIQNLKRKGDMQTINKQLEGVLRNFAQALEKETVVPQQLVNQVVQIFHANGLFSEIQSNELQRIENRDRSINFITKIMNSISILLRFPAAADEELEAVVLDTLRTGRVPDHIYP
jgi:hypothetical protein